MMRAISSRKRVCYPMPGNGTTYLGASLPAAIAASFTVPNAAHHRHDCERLIGPDALGEASLRAQTLGLAFRARQVIHGRQHKVIEKPTR